MAVSEIIRPARNHSYSQNIRSSTVIQILPITDAQPTPGGVQQPAGKERQSVARRHVNTHGQQQQQHVSQHGAKASAVLELLLHGATAVTKHTPTGQLRCTRQRGTHAHPVQPYGPGHPSPEHRHHNAPAQGRARRGSTRVRPDRPAPEQPQVQPQATPGITASLRHSPSIHPSHSALAQPQPGRLPLPAARDSHKATGPQRRQPVKPLQQVPGPCVAQQQLLVAASYHSNCRSYHTSRLLASPS
jgi:hypothetical protein